MKKSRLKWWVKERHNGQHRRYFVAQGQITKAKAQMIEHGTLAGFNIMHAFDTETKMNAFCDAMKRKGEEVL